MKLSAERNASFARRLIEHIRAGTTDMADGVVAFDPKIYSDPAIAAREMERIFESAPVMAAHSSEIPEPGDFVTVRLMSGGQSASVALMMSNQLAYLQYPAAAANAVVLLTVVLMIVAAMMRIVDIRKEL